MSRRNTVLLCAALLLLLWLAFFFVWLVGLQQESGKCRDTCQEVGMGLLVSAAMLLIGAIATIVVCGCTRTNAAAISTAATDDI